ncbi:MAG: S8 family serine peptidase [Gallionellaceae bacterium]|nr:S8 family serine peptidase [Gallionellaceae bacterium]
MRLFVLPSRSPFQANEETRVDRKNLGIIAGALVLVISILWLAQGDDEGAQAALPKATVAATGSTAASANPVATPGRNGNAYSGAQQSGRSATHLTQAGQGRTSAPSTARNHANSSDTKSSTAPFESPIQTRPRVKPTPLEPRAEPYALMVNSGSVTVRFSVRLTGDADPSTTVYLRQSGAEGVFTMNDLGVDGDIVARDNIHGANIVLDTSRLQPDTCLSYIASVRDGESETVSSPLNLCISSLPVRVAASNTDNPVVFADGTKAVSDEIIVTAQPGTQITAMQALAASINATIVGSIPPLNLYQLKLPSPATEAQLTALVAQLNARPEVQEASLNAFGTFSSSDPNFSGQHGLQLIRAQDVWASGATGSGVTVVVIDSGLSLTHPDLVPSWTCQLPGNPTLVACTDTVGHGTQVAGVISAVTDNAIGVAGIAYGSNIHSIKVNSTPNPNDPTHPFVLLADMQSAFVDAASYVASHGSASIVNASFTVQVSNFTNVSALCQSINSVVTSGAVVVNAAGNDNSNG